MSVSLRFEALYGPDSADRPGLPKHLRQDVYSRMRHAFSSDDPVTLQHVRRYFRSIFHPDKPDSAFSADERHAVFTTHDYLFDGKDLVN